MKLSCLGIGVTNACNIHCAMCPHSMMVRSVEFMKFSLYKKIIDESVQNGVWNICLSDMGEPLLHKELPEMIAYAKQMGIERIWFPTNATLITAEIAKKLIEAGLDYIEFSVTGATQEVYEKFQGYNSPYTLQKVEQAIEAFLQVKKDLKSDYPKTAIRYIVRDVGDLADLAAYCRKWWNKVDDVLVTHFCTMSNLMSELNTHSRQPCPKLLEQNFAPVVLPDGTVVTCCVDMMNPKPTLILGDMRSALLGTILDKPFLENLRQVHRNLECDKWPEICKMCDASVPGMDIAHQNLFVTVSIFSLIDFIRKSSKSIIIWGATSVAQFILGEPAAAEHVIAVVDSYKKDMIFSGYKIQLPEDLEKIDNQVIVVVDPEQIIQVNQFVLGKNIHVVDLKSEIIKINHNYFKIPEHLIGLCKENSDLPWIKGKYGNFTLAFIMGLHQIITTLNDNSDPIVLFGANEVSEYILEFEKIKKNVIAVIDSYKDGLCSDINIRNPNYLQKFNGIVIVASPSCGMEIANIVKGYNDDGRLRIIRIDEEYLRATIWLKEWSVSKI